MTTTFEVVAVVEGHGEVSAVPELLRRLAAAIDPNRAVHVHQPVRGPRSKLVRPEDASRYLELAVRKLDGARGAVLVLFDADDDCAATLGPKMLTAYCNVRREVSLSVVLAVAEFESWFLASAESLRGRRGLPDDLVLPPQPEGIRNAKGWLQQRRIDGLAYSSTTDQPALAAVFDLELARRNSPSFDKLWRDVARLMAETAEPVD